MEFLNCEVCWESYDDGVHLPRCLTCGHSLCTSCICQILLHKGSLKCPFCRVRHLTLVATSDDVAVNYTILKVLQRENHVSSSKIVPENKPNERFSFLKQELAKNTDFLVRDFENDLIRLRKFQKRLESKEESHAQLMAKIPEYVMYLKEIGTELSELKRVTEEAIKKGGTRWHKMKMSREYLKGSKTLEEMFAAHKSIVRCLSSVNEWNREAQELQCSKVLKKYKTVSQVTCDALATVPVKREKIFVKEGMDGLHVLLYIVAFGCGIISAYFKAS